MDNKADKKLSKFLSLILRHQPERVGVSLDAAGWADVEDMLDALRRHGTTIDRKRLERVVATNNKQRFAFSDDGTRIRANQGHSLDVDLALAPQTPPDVLFHGTAVRNLNSIRQHGLQKRSRQHVHLSASEETAVQVGQRHGKPVVLQIQAGAMHKAGYTFFLSKNGVWLTDHVPSQYIAFP